MAENISRPYKRISIGGSFWEPFLGAILDLAALKKRGIATNVFFVVVSWDSVVLFLVLNSLFY
jgi:hypothetical protein